MLYIFISLKTLIIIWKFQFASCIAFISSELLLLVCWFSSQTYWRLSSRILISLAICSYARARHQRAHLVFITHFRVDWLMDFISWWEGTEILLGDFPLLPDVSILFLGNLFSQQRTFQPFRGRVEDQPLPSLFAEKSPGSEGTLHPPLHWVPGARCEKVFPGFILKAEATAGWWGQLVVEAEFLSSDTKVRIECSRTHTSGLVGGHSTRDPLFSRSPILSMFHRHLRRAPFLVGAVTVLISISHFSEVVGGCVINARVQFLILNREPGLLCRDSHSLWRPGALFCLPS